MTSTRLPNRKISRILNFFFLIRWLINLFYGQRSTQILEEIFWILRLTKIGPRNSKFSTQKIRSPKKFEMFPGSSVKSAPPPWSLNRILKKFTEFFNLSDFSFYWKLQTIEFGNQQFFFSTFFVILPPTNW